MLGRGPLPAPLPRARVLVHDLPRRRMDGLPQSIQGENLDDILFHDVLTLISVLKKHYYILGRIIQLIGYLTEV